jgi:hypothetical protein
MVFSYFLGLVTEQVPSDRLVTTVPSGRVTLAVEKLSTLPDPFAEPDADDEAELDDPLPIVVDEVTLPLSAVTVVDVPPVSGCFSTRVQVV